MSTVLQAIEAVISQGIGAMRKLSLTSGDYSVLSTDKVRAPQLIDWSRRYGRLEPVPGILSFAGLASGGSTNWNCVHPKGQNGAPLYVRVGSGGAIQTSTDGATWTTRASGTTSNLNSVTYKGAGANQGFWAVGGSARLYSADGVTWETKSTTGGNVITFSTTSPDRGLIGGSGYFAYITTDGGSTWTTVAQGDSQGSRAAAFVEDNLYYVTRNTEFGNATRVRRINWDSPSHIIQVSPNIYPFFDRQMLVLASGRVVISGDNGGIYYSDTPGASGPWVSVTVSGARSLRLMEANGLLYAFGEDGEMYVSDDGGATWVPGPSTGVSTFLRFGIHDPSNPSRAIVVGDSGVTLAGGHGFQLAAYTSPEERDAGTGGAPSDPVTFAAQTGADATMSIPGVLSAKVTGVAPEDLPLSFDVEISPHTTGYHFDYAAANLLDPASWPAGHAVARFDFLEDARDEVHRIVAHDTFATPLVFRGWPPAEADVSPEDLARRFRDDIARMMNALRPALQEAGMVLLSNPQYPRAIPRLVRARPVEAQVLYTLIWRQPAPRPLAPA